MVQSIMYTVKCYIVSLMHKLFLLFEIKVKFVIWQYLVAIFEFSVSDNIVLVYWACILVPKTVDTMYGITVCTVVQNCCKGPSKSIGNGTFRVVVEEKPLNWLTQNLVWVITSGTRLSTANGMSVGSGAWPPRRGEVLMVCAFLVVHQRG